MPGSTQIRQVRRISRASLRANTANPLMAVRLRRARQRPLRVPSRLPPCGTTPAAGRRSWLESAVALRARPDRDLDGAVGPARDRGHPRLTSDLLGQLVGATGDLDHDLLLPVARLELVDG